MPKFVYRQYKLLLFSLGAALVALCLLLSPFRAAGFVIDPLNTLVAAVLALTVFHRLQVGAPHPLTRLTSLTWFGVLLLTLVLEWGALQRGILLTAVNLKEPAEFFLWLLAPIGLFVTSRFERIPPLVKHLLVCGFVAQTAALGLELAEDASGTGLSAATLEALSDFCQFAFLQLYLIAFAMLLLYAGWSPIAHHAESDLHSGPLGNRARHIFDAYALFEKGRFPKQRAAHWPGAMPIIDFCRIVIWSAELGGKVRQRFGVPLFRQVLDILLLTMHCGLDAQAYYMLELYRRDRQRKAGQFLTRYETKNGLFTALNRFVPKAGRRSNLSDKAQFDRRCLEHGLPVPPVIALSEGGRVTWIDKGRLGTARGLFLKPTVSKGARGAEVLPAKAGDKPLFLSPSGLLLDTDGLAAYLAQASEKRAFLVQERVENAPSVARFAQDSLVVVRVITCLDALGAPAVTHGMLRILGKLEPAWPTEAEYGAPIDLGTGTMGMLASDKREDALDFFDHHPMTGARIAGEILPEWPAVRDLALRAHRAFCDRFVIGWDIAVTPQGPLLIEGNAHPDFAFLQRVHRQPAGDSPIGPLLQAGLDRLVAARSRPAEAVAPAA